MIVDGDGVELGIGLLSESFGTLAVSIYMILGGVGARDTPSIQGRKKETMDRSLTTPLGLRRDPTCKGFHVLNCRELFLLTLWGCMD